MQELQAQIKDSHGELTHTIEDLKANKKALEDDLQDLRTAQQDLQDLQDQYQTLENENGKKTDDIIDLNNRLSALEDENKRLQDSNEELSDQASDQKKRAELAARENAISLFDLQQTQQALQKKDAEIGSLKKQIR